MAFLVDLESNIEYNYILKVNEAMMINESVWIIDYSLLADAKNYYIGRGYTYIEVPWFIPDSLIDKAPKINSFKLTNGKFIDSHMSLVGSAEQSFLYLAKTNQIREKVKYMSITPCFREDEKTELHQPTFMKLELFQFGFQTRGQAIDSKNIMCRDAYEYLKEYSNGIKISKNPHSDDIEINEVEVGSYYVGVVDTLGFFPMHTYYACGTGIALPRLMQATARDPNWNT